MGVFKRGGIWYIRFQVDGREIVRSAGQGATKAQAAEELKALREKSRARKLGITLDGLLTSDLLEWIDLGDADEAAPGKVYGLKPSTWLRYKVSIAQIVAYLGVTKNKELFISEIDRDWLANYVTHRQTIDKVTNRTIRRDLDALSLHFQWLMSKNRVSHNRVRDFDVGAIPELKTEIVVPSIRLIQTIIDVFHGMLARLIAFQALMGLRQAEAVYLEWSDYDPAAKTITIPKSKTSWPRTIHLYNAAIEILESLPRPPDHLTAPRGGYIFWHDDGEPFAGFPSTWGRIVHDLLGYETNDHHLRHFAAWLYLRRGGRLVGLKSFLGHRKGETTEQYAHIADDIQHYDLIIMGERPPLKDPEQFNIRFDFGKSGPPSLAGAELKARSLAIFSEIRSRRVIELLDSEDPEAFSRRLLRDPAWLPPLREKLAHLSPAKREKATRIIAAVGRAAAAGKTNKRWPARAQRADTAKGARYKTGTVERGVSSSQK